MADIIHVADFFLVDAADDEDDQFDAYRLHMLCVYAHVIMLGYTGKPLCQEDIRMYDFGPAFPSLLEQYPLEKDLPKIDLESDPEILWSYEDYLTKLETRVIELVEVTYGLLANWYIRERVKLDFKDFLSSRDVISKDDLKAKFHKFLLPLSKNTISLWDLGIYPTLHLNFRYRVRKK